MLGTLIGAGGGLGLLDSAFLFILASVSIVCTDTRVRENKRKTNTDNELHTDLQEKQHLVLMHSY